MSAPDEYLAYRVRYLPVQLQAARHKVRALESEALRLGLLDLLTADAAWNDTIREAQVETALRGGSIGFREDAK